MQKEGPNKLFWAVAISGGQYFVSIITDDYYQLLQDSRTPQFYKNFQYKSFYSQLSFSELQLRLPLPVDFDQIESSSTIDPLMLSNKEQAHFDAHRKIISIYKTFHLEPVPPWFHIKADDEVSVLLANELGRLKDSCIQQ